MKFVIALLVVAVVVGKVESYASGAPLAACGDMMPQHTGAVAQTSQPPYSIFWVANGASYNGDSHTHIYKHTHTHTTSTTSHTHTHTHTHTNTHSHIHTNNIYQISEFLGKKYSILIFFGSR